MYLIVGLGNPGRKYQNTRHNLGFLCVDFISQRHNITVNKIKHKAVLGEGTINDQKVILAKPQTYMNLSGESVRDIASWYKIPNENIIIIYDDINLDAGKIRIRAKGSDGGHNGMKSIIFQLNSNEFPRIRVGIGQAKEKMDLADFVLSKIGDSEKEDYFKALENASKAVELIISGDINQAMNEYN